jgi:diguanylate cyclase (GGDEF)-like protein/PAS domain S-box-containing protein
MFGEDEVGFHFLAENSTDIVCWAGVGMVLGYASPSSMHILGWRPEEMKGRRLTDFVLAEDAAVLAQAFDTHRAPNVPNSACTVRMTKKDGTLTWMELKHHVLQDATPGKIVVIMHDLSNRMLVDERPSALAVTDSLTGLATHHAFLRALEREWTRASRESSPLSLLLLDFNEFRQFHGAEGHGKGDSCLSRAAAAVIGSIRMTDLAARYGSEAIAIILPFTDADGVARIVSKLRAAIEPLRIGDDQQENRGMVSIGVSTVFARAGGTSRMPEILLLTADHALRASQHEEAKPRRPSDSERTPATRWKMNLPSATSQCA